jgi:DNA-binding MarR family transcriptional regulator
MTDQPQTQRQQFTPVFDEIRDSLGMNAALVFGAVWRFCQMESGHCTASQETIAARCCMKRAAANRAIAALVGAGYLLKTRNYNGVILRDAGKLTMEKKEPQLKPAEADQHQTPDVSDLDGEIRQMSDAFVKAAGVQPFRMPEWIKALREMHGAGIRAETITAAVEKLRGTYTISGPWSIVKTAISMQASGNQPSKPAGNFGTIHD